MVRFGLGILYARDFRAKQQNVILRSHVCDQIQQYNNAETDSTKWLSKQNGSRGGNWFPYSYRGTTSLASGVQLNDAIALYHSNYLWKLD